MAAETNQGREETARPGTANNIQLIQLQPEAGLHQHLSVPQLPSQAFNPLPHLAT